MKVRFLKRDWVEGRASWVLREYQRRIGRGLSVPIDAELVGGAVFNLSWDWDEIDEPLGQRVLAGLYVGEARAVLNERHLALFESKPGLEHYTRAHEVGHAELHTPPGGLGSRRACGLILHRDESQHSGETYWLERQADWFAAALLMPADLFMPLVQESFPATAVEAGHVAEQVFGVTYTAFNLRMKELGLPYFDKSGHPHEPISRRPGQHELF